ncbi:DNA-3-methyladenine glycosylase II [Gracilibacillus halotolerans]|uniref:DNA-3-methyladenine glycosylase II n=1 Tax=Gracilibacillus halotolerans TaxID=74386 RepID=A0A841RL91_9BACI|nr:DNA-3-methyladenine glycosylase [Gracilibacillus halotolerans]MBB6513531.1 DNA-3-methyladenine glycosylase II [Gracilibacillus halotolerans]
MWQETLQLSTPYDFDYILLRLQMDQLNYSDVKERKIYVPLRIGQEKTIATVTSLGTTDTPIFQIEGKTVEHKQLVMKRIEEIFGWEQDLIGIQSYFLQTNLADLFTTYPATPLVREFDSFGNLTKTIIHQQLNMAFAQTLTLRFVQTYGDQMEGLWFFPTPERVAEIPYEELQALQFSRRKAEYVVDTAKKIVSGETDLSSLDETSDEDIMKSLTKLRGVGPWTVQNWLMFSLGRPDLFPIADIGIQNALKIYFGMEKKPTIEQMEDWMQAWKPYRSYAAMTLWRSIEEPEF